MRKRAENHKKIEKKDEGERAQSRDRSAGYEKIVG